MVTCSNEIDDWGNFWFVGVNFAVSITDQTPEFIAVDGWSELSVWQNTELSHTNLTEVTWMALIEKNIKLYIFLFLFFLFLIQQ